MSNQHSILLDLLRLIAAILVFIHHSEQILDIPSLSIFASFGHDAVIFFFILSGFVINYVSSEKENSLYDYFVARAARILSVSYPSLILVILLFAIGKYFFPEYYTTEYRDVNWLKTIGYSLLFLNQTSIASIHIPTNGPYWSVSYEVWYYIIFGLFFYIKNSWKWIITIFAILIAGLKIVILFPVWLLGYYFFRFHKKIKENSVLGVVIFSTSIAIYLIIRKYNLDDILFHESTRILFSNENIANNILGYSKRFAPDFLISIIFATIIGSLFMLTKLYGACLETHENIIRKMASYTFSIYLFHYPLLTFINIWIENPRTTIISTALIIILLNHFTENKKKTYKTILIKLTKY